MRKKEFWDYEKKDRASGHSLGSRLLRIFLVGGCFIASATIVISLFFYYYPSEAARTALAVQDFAKQLAGIAEPEEDPPLQSASAPRNLQQSPSHPSAAASAVNAVPLVVAASQTGI